jgi:hypothetical protein
VARRKLKLFPQWALNQDTTTLFQGLLGIVSKKSPSAVLPHPEIIMKSPSAWNTKQNGDFAPHQHALS